MPNEMTLPHDPESAPEAPKGRQWQPLNLVSDEQGFEAYLQHTRPREAAAMRAAKMDRRTFLKIMGASLALTGLGAAGCTPRTSDEPIIPYVRMPEELVPGIPLFFASSMILGGYAHGILIETHEGRPTRVEGNPLHPASLGGSNAMIQASVLELYNPQRLTNVVHNGERSTWEAFTTELLTVLRGRSPEGLRILTETITSPTLAAQINRLLEQFPGAQWVQYEPVSRDNVTIGAELAFGEPVNTVYRFDQAEVVLALDADFMSTMPGSLRYARDFTSRRKVRFGSEAAAMNRLFVVESTPTITGSMADHRLALRPSQVEAFTRALAAALGIAVEVPTAMAWSPTWFDGVVANLRAAGSSIVIAGDEQPPAVHALVHAINDALGSVGTTVVYTAPVEASSSHQNEAFANLVADMQAREVAALVMIGGDPVYNAPADLPFAEGLAQVDFTAHLSYYNNDTAARSQWFVPQTHYIEEWSDARTFDGSASIVQPPIGALYDTVVSAHQLLAAMLGDERSGYTIVREYWQSQYQGDDFEMFWRRSLHDGVVPDSALPAITPTLVADVGQAVGSPASPTTGLEINFRPDPNIWDGRFVNNAWLQELPKPLTKITWDNAALVSATTAASLGLQNDTLVRLTLDGREMLAPVYILRGQPDDVITVSLGYGRGLGADVDAGQSFNAYLIRSSAAPWFAGGLNAAATNTRYPLAVVRANVNVEKTDPVQLLNLAEYQVNPEPLNQEYRTAQSIYPDYEYNGNSWGMTIDLTACIGCNACIIGCQTENNIPTVGKEAVARQREMHWLRVDRYYVEEEGEDVKTVFQPLPCMHCETAPCEPVCPVTATVHDNEGLNTMIYNRCVGTRYCSANCPYSVRRFNYLRYVDDEPLNAEWRNPNVTVRIEGVMEKCTYCTQRINAARIRANNENRPIADGEVTPACASACPTQAIVFGNLNDPNAQVVSMKAQPHNYGVLEELNTKPRTTYLARLYNPDESLRGTEGE
jgi:molybdopterin-containing oxidoreductase family iron-sulfur binding subunit